MLAAGLPIEAVEAALEREAAEHPPFEVYADNWQTVEVFRALFTQWRVIALPLGGVRYQGIDYASVTPLLLESHGVKRHERADVIGGLRVMEAAALGVLNAPKEA